MTGVIKIKCAQQSVHDVVCCYRVGLPSRTHCDPAWKYSRSYTLFETSTRCCRGGHRALETRCDVGAHGAELVVEAFQPYKMWWVQARTAL